LLVAADVGTSGCIAGRSSRLAGVRTLAEEAGRMRRSPNDPSTGRGLCMTVAAVTDDHRPLLSTGGSGTLRPVHTAPHRQGPVSTVE
jgi:hypothetical protein